MPTRRTDPPPPVVRVPPGYVLVREDTLNALLREAIMAVRLAAISGPAGETAAAQKLWPYYSAVCLLNMELTQPAVSPPAAPTTEGPRDGE